MKKYELLEPLLDRAGIKLGVVINDEERIDEYRALIDNDLPLPDDVYRKVIKTYIWSEAEMSNKPIETEVFYEKLDMDAIEVQIRLKDLEYHKRIANALNFFKVLAIITLVIMLVFGVVYAIGQFM